MEEQSYQRPKVGESLHKVLLRDRTKALVVGAGDGNYSNPNVLHLTLLQELRYYEVVVAASNLQEGDGETVNVHGLVVRFA